ncbi:MAG: response regulator transcription factor [Chloroflexota bacterium]
MTRVLVVYEEMNSLGPAIGTLEGIGFDVVTSAVEACSRIMAECKPDLVLLDLGDEEGRMLRLCESLRTQSPIPLIALGLDNRWLVPALSAGADDYLAKPIDLPTLVAKVLALLRRSGYAAEARRSIQVRDLTIDLDRCQVTLRGEALALTPIEYRILGSLARRAGRVIPCAELLKEAQGYDVDEQEARDIIKVHIYHLRRKLEPGEAKGDYIKTVPGFGYMLERRSLSSPSLPQQGWMKRGFVRQEPVFSAT